MKRTISDRKISRALKDLVKHVKKKGKTMTKLDRIAKRRERAFLRWREKVAYNVRQAQVMWIMLVGWDTAYHDEMQRVLTGY